MAAVQHASKKLKFNVLFSWVCVPCLRMPRRMRGARGAQLQATVLPCCPWCRAALRAVATHVLCGTRPSLCGKFAINGAGAWRELPVDQQVSQPHEFLAVGPDGKPLSTQPRS